MASWGQTRPKTKVQEIIDQDKGKVQQLLNDAEAAKRNQQNQIEAQKSYPQLVAMYPEEAARIRNMIKEGVHDPGIIAKTARLQHEKRIKAPAPRSTWEKIFDTYKRTDQQLSVDMRAGEYVVYGFDNDPDSEALNSLLSVAEEIDLINQQDPIQADGLLEDLIISTSNILPSIVMGAEEALPGAAAGGIGALILGQLGPQALTQEEFLTVPAGIVRGGAASATHAWMLQGTGSIFLDGVKSGVHPNNAKLVATLGGAAYGMIERISVSKLIPKGFNNKLKDIVTGSLSISLGRVLKGGVVNYAHQNLQEVTQETILIASEEINKHIDNAVRDGNIESADAQEIKDRLWQTLEATAKGMIIPVGMTTTVTGVQTTKEVKKQQPTKKETPRETQAKAIDEVNAAEEAGETTAGTAALTRYLLDQDPDFDSRSSLEISNEVVNLTDDYIKNELKQDPEEFFKQEGITREEAEQYYATGSTQVDIQKNTTRTAIKLYKGHDADTVVEEFYHDFFEHLNDKDKAAFEKYHEETGDTRSLEEHFGQEGRDFFFSEKLHEKAGGVRKLFEQARQTLKDLIERIRKIRGANIPQKIQDLYTQAGTRDFSQAVSPKGQSETQFQVKRVPKASENVPVLPTGPIEDQLNKAFKRKPEPSSIMLKKVQGAPSKRKGMERTLDKDVKIEPYNVYVERAKSVRDKTPEQGLWYNEYGEGGKKIVGKENMREFSILFGVTSKQTKTTDNLDNTIHIMTVARKIDPVKNEAAFRAELKKPKPSGNKMLITDSQVDAIVRMYKTGTYDGGLKVSTYMQTVEAAANNEFMPFTVNDVHMQRFFGFLRKDKQGKTLGINESNHRYIQYLTSKIAEDMGVAPSQAQAYMWQWARENMSDVKSVGTWAEAVKYSENSIKKWNKVQSPVTNINAKFGEGAKPGYTGSQKTGPYSNVLYTDAIMKEINRKSPKVLASFVPGRARGFLTGEVDLKKAREYDDAVFKAITDESGQIKFLKDIKIPHEVVRTMGSYGNLETSYQIILPGASLETAEMVAAYLGDAGLQDSAIHYKNTFGAGDLGGLAVTKSDNKVWTDTEIEKFHTTVNPNNDVDGVNFYQSSDGKQLRVMVFPGMEEVVSNALESYNSMTNFEIGRFDQTGDLTEHESYNKKIREAVKKQPLLRLRRSNIQRSSQRNLYRPIQEVYKKFEKDFQPEQKITFQARKKAKPTLELDKERFLDKVQRKIQDKMNRLGHVVKKVSETRKVSDEEDAYLASELYIGRAREKMDKFEKAIFSERGSLLDRIMRAGYTLEEFGKYLHARHAKERNDHIASIRDDMPDGGSGMTNKEANKILKKHRGDKQIQAFAREFYNKVTKKTLKDRLKAGLITDETYETLTNYYKNYVPLFVVKDEETRTAIGKGFSVPQGAEIKRTRGSTKDRTNPVYSGIYEMMNVIRKSEKNRVGLKFLKLAEEFESSAWDVAPQKYRPIFGEDGEIQYMDPKFKLGETVFGVRRDGKLFLITINDTALARGLKNLGTEKANKYIVAVNNYLRSIVTTFNPGFIITNFARDIQTALIHVGGEHKGLAAKVLKNTPRAIRGVFRNVRGKEKNYWSDRYDELKSTGGKVGWFDMDSLVEHQEKVEKVLKNVQDGKGSPRRAAKAIGDFVNNVNEAVESGVRLATYDALRKQGMTKARAAQVAKNITVNFNKKGEWGTLVNSFYMFSNATIQGTARIAVSLGKSKKTRAIVGSIVGMSTSLGLINYMVAPEEWEKKNRWEKDNYLIFMMPNGEDIRIRVPYGYNIFHTAGQSAADIIQQAVINKHGFKSVRYTDHAIRVFGSINDAVSPFGSGSVSQVISPTITDPLVQIGENKKFTGAPIYPEKMFFQKKKARYKNYWDSNPPTWVSRAVTEGLSNITGGKTHKGIKTDKDGNPQDHYIPGWFDMNPLVLDHLGGFLTGGLGKFISRSVNTGINFAVGKPTASRDIPIIRQFYGQPDKRGFTEKRLIRKMIDNSEIEVYNHVEVARFKRYVHDAIKLGVLSETDAKLVKDETGEMVPKVIRDFLNSQRNARGEKKLDYRKLGKKKGKVTF